MEEDPEQAEELLEGVISEISLMVQPATKGVRIYQPRLNLVTIIPRAIFAIHTRDQGLSGNACSGHLDEKGSLGVLGTDSPKASLELSDGRYVLLCKACWESQKLTLEEAQ